MDEVARERASAAHRRLDGINGQIKDVREEIAGVREDHAQAVADLRVDMAKLGTKIGLITATAAVVAGALLGPLVSRALNSHHPVQQSAVVRTAR